MSAKCEVSAQVAVVLAAFSLVLVCLPANADTPRGEIPTWTKQGMLSGASINKQDCPRDDRVWVEDAEGGHCIRYFTAGSIASGRTPVLFLKGDFVGSEWDRNGRPVRAVVHLKSDGRALYQATATFMQTRLQSPLILIARPGSLGSSGDHKEKYKPREASVMNAAIDAIKARHGLNDIVLAGHSGGATLVANMLPERADLNCAVMSSGGVALHRYSADHGFAFDVYSQWQDPLQSASRLGYRATVFYILAGQGDKIRPARYQQVYADALIKKRLEVHFLEISKPRDPHNLENEALQVADACARGLSFPEIERSLKLAKRK